MPDLKTFTSKYLRNLGMSVLLFLAFLLICLLMVGLYKLLLLIALVFVGEGVATLIAVSVWALLITTAIITCAELKI